MNSQKLDLSQVQSVEKMQKVISLMETLPAGDSLELSDDSGLMQLLQQLPPEIQNGLLAYAVHGSDHDQKLKIMRRSNEDGGCCGSCTCGG